MAVSQTKPPVGYKGLSADTKPVGNTIGVGSTFTETDTGNRYEYDGDSWNQTSTNGAMNTSLATLISGEDQTNDVLKIEAQFNYETVAASQTAQVLGGTGAVGDYLHSVIVASATGTVTVLDNAVSVLVIPAGSIGVWSINALSVSGAWKITTAAATTCTAIGRFTA